MRVELNDLELVIRGTDEDIEDYFSKVDVSDFRRDLKDLEQKIIKKARVAELNYQIDRMADDRSRVYPLPQQGSGT